MTIATAESCTGGMLAAKITSVPGVSSVYAGGFVTYATEEKHKMLGVPRKILRENGAVSKKTAKLMAAGAARETGTDVAPDRRLRKGSRWAWYTLECALTGRLSAGSICWKEPGTRSGSMPAPRQ